MNNIEFSEQFDILLNAHGEGYESFQLDEYEKSVLLTDAQNKVLKTLYKEFETSELIRESLRNLIRHKSISTKQAITAGINIVKGSTFYKRPDDLAFIIHETVSLISSDECVNGKIADVKPISHDDYNSQKKNPFRKPSKTKAWRLDYGVESNNKLVEIIVGEGSEPDVYNIRYIKKPVPIVLENLGLGGPSVEGITNVSQCELSELFHDDILELAVELAKKRYIINNN